MKPTVYLLCGLPGSGKTTYAKKLEEQGAARLTVDEEVFNRVGKNFNSESLDQHEKNIKEEYKERLRKEIQERRSVVLDYGFWKKSERDEYKQLAEELGGEWKLYFFDVPSDILKSRVVLRNENDSENNHVISEELLERFILGFEKPTDEGEEIITEA